MPWRKGTLRIRTGLAEGQGQVLIEVNDNGYGIDESDMPHLFNPFFTTKKYGTGLGLTQVKKIIDLHQGSIEVQSRKGEGTRVIVTLPAKSERIEDRRHEGTIGMAKILIIDDDSSICETIDLYLTEEGHECTRP